MSIPSPGTEAEVIIKQRVPSTTPGRAGKFDVQILYRVGPLFQSVVVVPEEDAADKTKVATAIKADMATRLTIGEKIPL